MENLIFLFFILFIFILQSLGQILERRRKIPPEEKTSEESPLEDILGTQEIPLPQEEKIPLEVVSKEEEEKKEGIEEKRLKKEIKPQEIKPIFPEEREEIVSSQELETAIIYSTIIGPPKALQIRRGAGIGIQAGLKNRCP